MTVCERAILVDRKVVPEPDLMKWAQWFEHANRGVCRTILNRKRRIYVSTVFLGLDHSFFPGGRSLWFETMVFGSSINQAQMRYETWEEAEAGHAVMVRRARQARQTRNKNWDIRKAVKKLKAWRKGK